MGWFSRERGPRRPAAAVEPMATSPFRSAPEARVTGPPLALRSKRPSPRQARILAGPHERRPFRFWPFMLRVAILLALVGIATHALAYIRAHALGIEIELLLFLATGVLLVPVFLLPRLTHTVPILPPALGEANNVEWVFNGNRHVLEPGGLFVDGKTVAAANDGFDSVHLEIQRHESTGEQLWLIAAETRPQVRIVWQAALPDGTDGATLAAMLLRADPRVHDETPGRKLASQAPARLR